MAEGLEPSFGRIVFGRALSDTAQFLKYTKRDLILGGVTLALGGLLAYVFVGKADTVKEFAFIAAFTFAPAGIVMIAVFIWHLWLAPSVLAYEAVKATIGASPSPEPSNKPAHINWAPWKQRAEYSLYEFAKILSETDPAAQAMTTDGSAFLRLLREDVDGKRLKYISEYGLSYDGRRYEKKPGNDSHITRPDALAWAETRQFAVDHIR